MWISAILAAGGRGSRMGAGVPKQMLMIGDRTILQRSFETLESLNHVAEIIVALPTELAKNPPEFLKSTDRTDVKIVDGGATRHESVANAFAAIDGERADFVMIHDAARPFATPELFRDVIDAGRYSDGAIAALPATDTVKQVEQKKNDLYPAITATLPRESIWLAQTPQIFRYEALQKAIELGKTRGATDEAALVEATGVTVSVVQGEMTNIKVTTERDMLVAHAIASASAQSRMVIPRVGIGYDLHRLEAGRQLILGGVLIPHETGLMGHSDADVLCHAITDAMLGAAGQGDIGAHFPDTDARFKNAASTGLLSQAVGIVRRAGFEIANIDAVIIAERPKILPYVDFIRKSLSDFIGIDASLITVKGKTNEKIDALGRNEAIAVHAVAMLIPVPKA